MKSSSSLLLLLLFFTSRLYAQEELKNNTESNSLSALLNMNFTGSKESWSNLTPAAFYGFNTQSDLGHNWQLHLSAGPYLSSQIAIKDSSAYLPALMMQGNAGIILNWYFTYQSGKSTFFLSPANLGFKILSNFTDSSRTITQHNLRPSFGYQFDDKIMLSLQYTIGWHNGISSGEENFKELFKKSATEAKYLNLTAQFRVSKDDASMPLYLVASWRNFLNYKDYGLPNNKIITFGIATALSFSGGAAPAVPAK